jgi:hypothetical protein
VIPSFVSVPLFAGAMVFGAMANGLAFSILYRMRSLGYKVGLRRTSRDWALYREYWRIAPSKSWSRAPLPLAIASFAVGAVLLFTAVWLR